MPHVQVMSLVRKKRIRRKEREKLTKKRVKQ